MGTALLKWAKIRGAAFHRIELLELEWFERVIPTGYLLLKSVVLRND